MFPESSVWTSLGEDWAVWFQAHLKVYLDSTGGILDVEQTENQGWPLIFWSEQLGENYWHLVIIGRGGSRFEWIGEVNQEFFFSLVLSGMSHRQIARSKPSELQDCLSKNSYETPLSPSYVWLRCLSKQMLVSYTGCRSLEFRMLSNGTDHMELWTWRREDSLAC